ncbi:MAG: CoA-binding protein [Candidatus Micrarchaeota archaeon]|nr:CoA-binding protein [Candidatus Micrarchaeota archaeon]
MINGEETVAKILAMKIIAVVGLSDNKERPSYRVASYLKEHGYEIIPVNPLISEWHGLRSYPTLEAIPRKVDVVDIFRRSESIPPIVKSAIAIGAKAVWMQEGIVNEEAGKEAEKAGLLVVMDKCLMKEKERANE